VIDGVTGNGVIVDVSVKIIVGLGIAVRDGVLEGKATCGVAGTQALRRTMKTTMNNFFIQLIADG
jgi:hypothetical protein